ncbi:GNAT family N-acetyltransferase [Candidatus Sumerlaeota bacterium]|nr:GNAT family N-acetyltransferase [Candidatus Sumerlaeota bacterium]
MFEEYPKHATLRNGQTVTLRLMAREDEEKLLEFFRRLPPEDRLFLKDDVTDQKVVHSWAENLDYKRVIPVLALCEDRIIGDATLHRNRHGWSTHVGEIRLVTDPDYRRQRLGRLLAREIFFLALVLKLEKVVAQMMEDQPGAVRVFNAMGFEQEATLKNHVKDLEGKLHNLLIMSQDVVGFWRRIEDRIADAMADQSGE